MAMSYLWTGMVVLSLFFGALTGNLSALGAAALKGAESAVELCFAMCGAVCLWTGVMELMERCALTDRLAALFRPLLRRLLPRSSRDSETLAAVSANLSANLLGLGNAATPLAGVRASLGAADPFDILPCVWLASFLSVAAGLFAAKLLARFWRD